MLVLAPVAILNYNICHFHKNIENIAQEAYSKSLTVISSMQRKQIVTKAAFNANLTCDYRMMDTRFDKTGMRVLSSQ